MNSRAIATLLLSALLSSTSATGTETRATIMSDDELATRASAIVVGRVADVRSGRDLDTSAAQRYATITVDAAVKGTIAEREIVLKQATVDGQASFAIGERVLLFLETNVDGTLSTAGLWQGKWTIDAPEKFQQQAARFDAASAARGIFRGVGDRRTLQQLLDRARAADHNGATPERTYLSQPSAEEMRGAAHEPAGAAVIVPRGSASAAIAPSAPLGLTSNVSGSTVSLGWQAPPGAIATYIIEAGSAPGLSNLANFQTGNPATTFSTGGVGPGVYYVRVRAANADGASAPSNEVVLAVGAGCPIPAAPTGLRLISAAGGTVVLQWDPSPLAFTFVIEAGSAPGLVNLVNSDLGSNLPGLRATGVGAGSYFVRVRAKSPCGVSNPSNEILVTVGGGQGSGALNIEFFPDPAESRPPNSCSSIWGGPQWQSTIAVSNLGTSRVNITSFRDTEIDGNGNARALYSGNGNNFAFFYPCDDPNAFFGNPYLDPGQRQCLDVCYVLRTTNGQEGWTMNGVDAAGTAVSAAKTLRLPSWPYRATNGVVSVSAVPAKETPPPSPVSFDSLRPRD